MKSKQWLFIFILNICFICFPYKTYSAEIINLYVNIFSRSITVKEIEEFAKNGTSKGFLNKLLKNQDKKLIQELITKEYKAPIVLSSRLLYSQIGGVILKKISKTIYPNRIPEESISVLALKTTAIKAISENEEAISLLSFLKAYPSKVIAIDVIELTRVINKVESMNELVTFFSDSPLEKLNNQTN